MRIHKVVNRVYEGTVYYRWVLSVPPKEVRDLGWVDGQELETVVVGRDLLVRPRLRPRVSGRKPSKRALADAIERMALGRR